MKSLLEVLLDENDTDPIVLEDSRGVPVAFEQIAIIPHKGGLYCVLKPVEKMEHVADDEALVFRVDEEDDETVPAVEDDEVTALEVFEQYYDLIDAQT